jgi:hypothetical protein
LHFITLKVIFTLDRSPLDEGSAPSQRPDRVNTKHSQQIDMSSLVVLWSAFLTTNHEAPGLIPDSTMGIFAQIGEDSHGDHGLGS